MLDKHTMSENLHTGDQMGGQIPTISYYVTANNTDQRNTGLFGLQSPFNQQYTTSWQLQTPQNLSYHQHSLQNLNYRQHLPEKEKETLVISTRPVTRLIRYIVVDADPVLAEKAPGTSILTTGMAVLNGTDDRGFVMELASKLTPTLDEHNFNRIKIGYEDKEDKTKYLKAIKMSPLDVIIEVIKSY